MRLLKRVFISLIVLVIALTAISFIAVQFLDKAFVEKKVQEAANRKFTIGGDLKPQLGLMPSIKVEKVSFGNAPWGSRENMANIGELSLQLDIMQLISGAIKVNRLEIKDADILIEKQGDKWNFEFDKADKPKKSAKAEKSDESKKMTFDIDELEVINSSLIIKQDGKPTTIKADELKLSPQDDKLKFAYKGKLDDKVINLDFVAPKISQLMNSSNFSADDLKVQFYDYKFEGAAKVDLSKDKPLVTASISTDLLKLDSNEAVDGGEADKSSAKSEASANKPLFSNEPLPFEIFNTLDANVIVKIKELKSGDITISNIESPIKISAGVLTINPLRANFAGGDIDSVIKLSSASTDLNFNGKNLLMEKVLAEVAGFDDFKDGPTNIDIKLTGRGNSIQKIVNSLTGQTKIYMENGVYNKRITTGSLSEFAQLLGGGKSANSTQLNCVLSDIKWNGGTGKIQSMAVDTPHAYVLGKGDIKLASQKLDMVVTPKAKSPGLASFAVPLAVKGKFDDLSYFPDPKGTLVTLGAMYLTGGGTLLLGIGQDLGLSAEESPCAQALTQPTEQSPLDAIGTQKIGEITGKAAKSIDKNVKNKLEGLFQ